MKQGKRMAAILLSLTMMFGLFGSSLEACEVKAQESAPGNLEQEGMVQETEPEAVVEEEQDKQEQDKQEQDKQEEDKQEEDKQEQDNREQDSQVQEEEVKEQVAKDETVQEEIVQEKAVQEGEYTEAVETDSENEEIQNKAISTIQGIRKINGVKTSSIHCSKPKEETYVLEVEMVSKPADGQNYTYTWEKCDYIGYDDYECKYTTINNSTNESCTVAGSDAGNRIYRCTVSDGSNSKSFKFKLYADSLDIRCMVNGEETERFAEFLESPDNEATVDVEAVPGTQVALGVEASSSCSSEVTYQWYKGYFLDEEGGSQALNQKDSTYRFMAEKPEGEGDYFQGYYCVVSDTFETEVVQFSVRINTMEGTLLVNGKESAIDIREYQINGDWKKCTTVTVDTLYGQNYNLEVKMASAPKSGTYKYTWTAYGDCTGGIVDEVDKILSTEPKFNFLRYPDGYITYVCKVEDGKEKRYFFFDLWADFFEIVPTIGGNPGTEAYLNPGETVVLSVNAPSDAPSDIQYQWAYETGISSGLSAYKDTCTVQKKGTDTEIYRCSVDGRYIYFTLYPKTLTISRYAIDDESVSELKCAAGTKHTLAVEAQSSDMDADMTYVWSRIDKHGSEKKVANAKNRNRLTITRRDDSETYRCSVSDGKAKKSVSFYLEAEEDTPNPDTPNPDTPSPDTPNPNTPNPDTPNPDTPNPDAAKPDSTHSSGTSAATASSVPAVGTVLQDPGTGAVCRVAEAGRSVEYQKAPGKTIKSVNVPDTVTINQVTYQVTSIAPRAFKNCKKLKKLTVGANINTIGKQAFSGCKSLKTITVKSKVLKKVGGKAFKGINKKAKIKVPKSKLKAYKRLFKKSGLAKSVKVKK